MKLKTLLSFLVFTNVLGAQKLELYNYGVGYRVFEYEQVGNNPTTIGLLLQDPANYTRWLKQINYNTLWGSPGIQQVHTVYLTAEWKKNPRFAAFWTKHSLQTGLLVTTKLSRSAGAIAVQDYPQNSDTLFREAKYSLQNFQRFVGAQIGLNRRQKFSDEWQFFVGLHLQGSFTTTNYYQQSWDSSVITRSMGHRNQTNSLPNLSGKHFFQWQVGVPLGFEYKISKQNGLTLRAEFIAGLVGGRYRAKASALNEAHGFGLALMYQPKPGL